VTVANRIGQSPGKPDADTEIALCILWPAYLAVERLPNPPHDYGFLLIDLIRGDRVVIPRQQMHQLRMNEELVAPDGSFFQRTDFNELLEIARSCLATDDVSLNEILTGGNTRPCF